MIVYNSIIFIPNNQFQLSDRPILQTFEFWVFKAHCYNITKALIFNGNDSQYIARGAIMVIV